MHKYVWLRHLRSTHRDGNPRLARGAPYRENHRLNARWQEAGGHLRIDLQEPGEARSRPSIEQSGGVEANLQTHGAGGLALTGRVQ